MHRRIVKKKITTVRQAQELLLGRNQGPHPENAGKSQQRKDGGEGYFPKCALGVDGSAW